MVARCKVRTCGKRARYAAIIPVPGRISMFSRFALFILFLRLSVPLRTAIAARYVFLARSAGLQATDAIRPVIGRASLTGTHWICIVKTDLGSGAGNNSVLCRPTYRNEQII